jgi:hypothetical protein
MLLITVTNNYFHHLIMHNRGTMQVDACLHKLASCQLMNIMIESFTTIFLETNSFDSQRNSRLS